MKRIPELIFLAIRYAAALSLLWLCFPEEAERVLSLRFAVLIAMAGLLALLALTFLVSRVRLLRILFAVFLLAMCLFYFPFTLLPRLLGIAAILLLLYELAGEKKSERAVPLLVLGLLLLFVPVKETPLDWSKVQMAAEKAWRQVSEGVERVAWYLQEQVSTGKEETGYSGYFGEVRDLAVSDRRELTLRGTGVGRMLYLSGKTYQAFNGVSWSEPAEKPGFSFPRYLNLLCQNGVTKEEAALFSGICQTDITYELLRTMDALHPETTLAVTESSAPIGEDFSFPETEGMGTKYSLLWLELDYGSPYFEECLLKAGEAKELLPFEVLSDYAEELYGQRGRELLTEELYKEAEEEPSPERREMPSSGRTREFAEEITSSLSCDYEKLRAVEKTLRQYRYARKGGPETKDLVDTFLFQTGEGYCVHFASAAAELLNQSGIPSRLCTGYAVSAGKEKENGGIPVYGREAHAWAEGYIEGYGWVPLEATPAMYAASSLSWGRVLSEDRPEEKEEEEITPIPIPEPETPEEEIKEEEPAERNGRVILILLLLLIPAGILLRFAFAELLYLLLPDEKRLPLAIRSLRLRLRKRFPGEDEPLLSYEPLLPEEGREEWNAAIRDYYRFAYGGEKPPKDLCRRLRKLKRSVPRQGSFRDS